jgi:hypothetical protein
MASSLYPPLRIRDIPGPQPGQFGLVNSTFCVDFELLFICMFPLAREALSTA